MDDVNKGIRNFDSLVSKLSAVPKKSTPEKFDGIWHFLCIAINATKFEEKQIPFKSGVFAAVAVVDAKAPYFLPRWLQGIAFNWKQS